LVLADQLIDLWYTVACNSCSRNFPGISCLSRERSSSASIRESRIYP
jgi:hypothetical protein